MCGAGYWITSLQPLDKRLSKGAISAGHLSRAHCAAMTYQLSEIDRRTHAMLQIGTITDVDHAKGRARVAVGKRETGWLPLPGLVGHNLRAWLPAITGMQVQLSCPSGDPAQAVIGPAYYSPARPAPSDRPDLDMLVWDDGTTLSYDSAGQTLTIDTPGDIKIKAARTITITADGDITIQAGGDMRLRAGGTMHLDAAQIRALEG